MVRRGKKGREEGEEIRGGRKREETRGEMVGAGDVGGARNKRKEMGA